MTSIFVAKLDFGIGNDELRQAFARFGTVLKATVATDRETGKSRGFGFVEMANAEEAREAMGIDWMIWGELVEAIPPVYTETIGKQILSVIVSNS